MRSAEKQLQAAKAARTAMDEQERDWRVCETFTGEQWLQRNRGDIPAGPDTAEVAQCIRGQYEGNRRQARAASRKLPPRSRLTQNPRGSSGGCLE